VEFTSNGRIYFKKYSQKNNQGGVGGNFNALIVPVLSDSKGSQDPKGVAIGTTISITGHKSELSYQIYAYFSNKQKKKALLLLIDCVRILSSNLQESEVLTKDNEEESIMDLKQQNPTTSRKQNIRKASYKDEDDNFFEATA
ncbi:25211_t:CDS:2, partial [Gigaspora margarita]